MRSRALFAASLLVLSSHLWAAQPELCEPTFVEDFEADLSAWQVVEGDGCDINLCGWGNSEKQFYHRDQLQLADGELLIHAAYKDRQLRSGKITTQGHFSQQYGRFEARVRLPSARGSWPAFWLLPESPHQPWPLDGEIDILEWTGNEPHRLITAAHFGDLAPANVHYSETLLLPQRWDEGYHVVAMEWRPDELRWEVDGRVHSVMKPEHIAPWPWVFDRKPFYIILNLAMGGTLGGDIVPEDVPDTYAIDWVRVYPLECLD